MGLHENSLSAFYTLCRAVTVKSETDFDRFDEAFSEFFLSLDREQLPESFLHWLENPTFSRKDIQTASAVTGLSEEEVEALFKRRLKDQDDQHDGGHKWIGTAGYTPYGNRGINFGGIRIAGDSFHRSAWRVAAQRRYRDWRQDNTLDSRQFQAAFRSLRQISRDLDQSRTEPDLDATIRSTCQRGGQLQIEYTHPRKNMIRLLLLIDSGGSMERHQKLCSLLFQSIHKAGHFKDLKIYYFHNCVGNVLYEDPTLDYRKAIPTSQVLQVIPSDYRVIFVGDGEMAPEELVASKRWNTQFSDAATPLEQLMRFKARYRHIIWLHPQPHPTEKSYWTQTFELLEEHFDMYHLSLESLTQGMKKLMQNR